MSSSAVNEQGAQERLPRWVIAFAAGVMLSTCIPYLYHALTVPDGRVFTWVVENLYDQNSYFMWAEQVRDGKLFVHNFLTTEDHPALLPSLPWLLIGLVGRVVPVSPAYLYHLLRLAAGFLYLLVVYRLARRLFPAGHEPVFTVVIVGVGAGAGGFVTALNCLHGHPVLASADWMPELWAYHSLLLFPHFALSLLLMAIIISLLLDAYERPRWSLAIWAAVCMMALGYTQPYVALAVGLVLPIHFVVCRLARPQGWRGTWTNLVALLGALPPAALLAWQYATNPVPRGWAQTRLLSPTPVEYLLGFGIVLPLAVGGWIVLAKRGRPVAGRWLLLVWAVVGLLLLCSHRVCPFERRLVEGLHLPLAMLAAVAISRWGVPALVRRWPRLGVGAASLLWLALLGALMLPTNLVHLAAAMRSQGPTIPRDWVTASRWLRDHTDEQARVMTGPYVGNIMARYAQRRVYLGHWAMTTDFDRKFARWLTLCDVATPVAERERILRQSGCDFVAAQAEQRDAFAQLAALEEVLVTPELSLYRLAPVSAAARE